MLFLDMISFKVTLAIAARASEEGYICYTNLYRMFFYVTKVYFI